MLRIFVQNWKDMQDKETRNVLSQQKIFCPLGSEIMEVKIKITMTSTVKISIKKSKAFNKSG